MLECLLFYADTNAFISSILDISKTEEKQASSKGKPEIVVLSASDEAAAFFSSFTFFYRSLVNVCFVQKRRGQLFSSKRIAYDVFVL